MNNRNRKFREILDPIEVELAEQDFLSDLSEDVSSDSDSEENYARYTFKNRLFGRQRPLHLLLGSRTLANVILWRNKDISACLLGGATLIWLLFEWIHFHLIELVCYVLLLLFGSLYLWFSLANLASFTNIILPQKFPDIVLHRETFVTPALMLRNDYHQALRILGNVIFGTDSTRFLMVVVILWILSVIGSRLSFLTFLYIVTAFILTVPALYENYEDNVDTFAEKTLVQIKKHYKILVENVIQKLSKVTSNKDKKRQ